MLSKDQNELLARTGPDAPMGRHYKAEQLKKQGAPIDWFAIGKAIARPNGIAVARKAPHTRLNQLPMTFVDARIAIDQYEKWKALFRELFGGRGA